MRKLTRRECRILKQTAVCLAAAAATAWMAKKVGPSLIRYVRMKRM